MPKKKTSGVAARAKVLKKAGVVRLLCTKIHSVSDGRKYIPGEVYEIEVLEATRLLASFPERFKKARETTSLKEYEKK